MGPKTRGIYDRTLSFVSSALQLGIVCLVTTGAHAQLSSDHPLWQIGGFGAGGFTPDYEIHPPPNDTFGLNYQEEVKFFSAGLEVGRMLASAHGYGFLRGRPEAVIDVVPYWEVDEPRQTDTITTNIFPGAILTGTFTGYKEHGLSITPLLFRWNFMAHDSSRFVPSAQFGLGLLWTPQNFPQGAGMIPGTHTSQINFLPQLGVGESIFVRKKQSLNFGVSGIHVTSWGLGEYNPGVNAIVQITVGYSWWK
jgi:hypothetical protein